MLAHIRQHRHLTALALFLVLLLAIGGLALLFLAQPATASPAAAPPVAEAPLALPPQLPAAQGEAPSDTACRLCHEDSDAVVTFANGDTMPVQVDPAVVDGSAHGGDLACTSCHTPAEYQFPHAPVEAESLRNYQTEQVQATCERCHQQAHITSHPGPESENPVICTDCHSAHGTETVAAWEAGEPVDTCVACHTERGVPLDSPSQLTQVIQNGLFTQQPNNDYCLSCHTIPNQFVTLDSGERLYVTIDEERFHASVHGLGDEDWQPLSCTQCHGDYEFPHPPVVAETLREYSLERYEACAQCHEPKYEAAVDSVHGTALAEGVEEAAVCTDCHGSHYVEPPAEPRARISYTCRQCHSTIFNEYAQSVHGEALLEESNPDVPVCTSCHGVHDIGDPNLAAFRNSSPELCGSCHADEELMAKYDISTDVFETYVADFHGTTVTLFEQQDPTAETNKAVCYDCHGVHNIQSPSDPHSNIQENLLATCQQCHPDASENFPASWTSHFVPSLEHNPAIYLVNLFYSLVIPATVAFTGFLVATDVYRRIRKR